MNKFIFTTFSAALLGLNALSAYPMGLDQIGTIQDVSAAPSSYTSFAPSITSFLAIDQPGGVNGPVSGNPTAVPPTTVSDPSNILLTADSQVRVYYQSSSAAFHNTVGYSASTTLTPGQAAVIFPNASSTAINSFAGLGVGSFVDLGTLASGTNLNFFLGSDAANSGVAVNTFWNSDINIDGIAHVKAVQFTGTNFYLIAWEDLSKDVSDLDYNDVLMIVEVIPAPEPGTYLLMAAFIGVCYYMRARKLQTEVGK